MAVVAGIDPRIFLTVDHPGDAVIWRAVLERAAYHRSLLLDHLASDIAKRVLGG